MTCKPLSKEEEIDLPDDVPVKTALVDKENGEVLPETNAIDQATNKPLVPSVIDPSTFKPIVASIPDSS